MYIELTERCNMTCSHCCMSATARGNDMDFHTFQRAVCCAGDYDSYVTLGGGEPTLWKDFRVGMDWLRDMLLSGFALERVLMITNGSRYRNTMIAIRMMEDIQDNYGDSFFRVVLSDPNDGYHDHYKVNARIYEYFLARQRHTPHEWIRRVNKIIPVGRASSFKDNPSTPLSEYTSCACESLFCKWDGEVKACGCSDAPSFGNVHSGFDVPDGWEYGTCWKAQECNLVDHEEEEEHEECYV